MSKKWKVGCEGDYTTGEKSFDSKEDAIRYMHTLRREVGLDAGIYMTRPRQTGFTQGDREFMSDLIDEIAKETGVVLPSPFEIKPKTTTH